MIIDLSKDKSLLNILSKVELDEETTKLVERKSSASIIKLSLERNLNPSNIIKYRRYIIKATADEKKKQRAEENRAKELELDADLLEEDEAQSEEEVSDSGEARPSNLEAAAQGNLSRDADNAKKAYKQLSKVNTAINSLESIANLVKVTTKKVETPNGNKTVMQVIGGRKHYQHVAGNSRKSNELLSILRLLKDEPNYLLSRYANELVNGEFQGRDFSSGQEPTENEDKDINVKALQDRYNKLLSLEFSVDGTDEKISLIKVIQLQHMQLFKRESKKSINRPKRKKESEGILRYLKGSGPKVHNAYEKELKHLKNIMGSLTKIRVSIESLEETEKELEETLKNTDDLIAAKMKRLVSSLKTIMTTSEFKHKENDKVISSKAYNKLSLREQSGYSSTLSEEVINEKTASIKDLQNNPKKYINEAKVELEKELEEERAKLEAARYSFETFIKVKPHLTAFKAIVNLFSEQEPIDVVKVKITEAAGFLIKIKRLIVKVDVLSSKVEAGFHDAFKGLINNSDVKLTLESDGVDWGGLTSVDSTDMDFLDDAGKKMENLITGFESTINSLNHMIKGADSEPISEEEQQLLDEAGKITEAARQEKVKEMRAPKRKQTLAEIEATIEATPDYDHGEYGED